MPFIAIYITHSNEQEAQKVTSHLLNKKLVACANTFPISSAYWWKGQLENENEVVSIVKTTVALWDRVKAEVESVHPYDVPCIMKLQVEANEAYEQWVIDQVDPSN